MPKPDMSKKINIFHIVEFVLAVIAAFCMADNVCIHCDKHVIQMQLVATSAFGFLMIMSVVFFGMFFAEDVGEKSDLCYSALGGILCICSGILVLLFVTDDSSMENYNYYRLLIGGTALIINGIIFVIEFFLLIFKKSELE